MLGAQGMLAIPIRLDVYYANAKKNKVINQSFCFWNLPTVIVDIFETFSMSSK